MDQQESNAPPPADPAAEHAAAIATLTAEREQARTDLAAARTEQAAAITAARDAIRLANPGIPPALIDGGTVDDLTASVEQAKTVGAQFAALASTNGHGVTTPVPAPHVPAGGQPARPPTEGMSPLEKVAYGLGQRRANPPHTA